MATAAKKSPATKSAALVPQKPQMPVKADINNMLARDAGLGLGKIDAKDLAIPRLSILQSGSPQVKKSDGAYIKGAEEGDLFDSVAGNIFSKGDEGFKFIIVSRRKVHIEWVPQDQGGGFVAEHGSDDKILLLTTKNDKGMDMLKNGHQIVTHHDYYIVAFKGDGRKNAVISLKSSQAGKARKLNTVLSSLLVQTDNGKVNPPTFYSVFEATTVPESNDKGSWFGWSLPRIGNVFEVFGEQEGREIYDNAKQFFASVNSGEVKVAAPVADGGVNGGGPDDGDAL